LDHTAWPAHFCGGTLPAVPELPDIQVYIERLDARLSGKRIEKARLKSPFLVRTHDPPLAAIEGETVVGFRRIGKRIVFELSHELFLVLHLMIAGRLHMKPKGSVLAGKISLFALDFDDGSLVLTEAGTKRRASLHVVRGEAALAPFQRGGIEPLACTLAAFTHALTKENHTLKRSLTDPRLFSGIGNSYSDEILFHAKLSPTKLSTSLDKAEIKRLYDATRSTLKRWTEALRREVGEGFPEKVTAFRPERAVHGRYKQPCPVCGTKVQRIRYASNEVNYCVTCQTGGKLLADRGLSRLLGSDWPKSLEELEERLNSS
jgi:formamidopyrimidine-DNA glycosylase